MKTVINSIEKEMTLAREWESNDSLKTTPYKPKFLTRVTLAIIDKLYEENNEIRDLKKKVTAKISFMPE